MTERGRQRDKAVKFSRQNRDSTWFATATRLEFALINHQRPTGVEFCAMSQFDNVSVIKKSNVYFDGRCVSHTVLFADGTKKTVGVIFPSSLTFNTGAPEIMEVLGGRCRVQLAGEAGWQEYGAGQSFNVPGNSSFQIETLELLDYVCHFA